jgi:hypothetical protein
MTPAAVACPSCKTVVTPEAFLSACSNFWSVTDTVRFTCPACQTKHHARVEYGQISLGYIYASGSPHFCGMEEIPVPDLSAWRDGKDLVAELDEVEWRIVGSSE